MKTRFYRALIIQDESDGPDDGYGVVFPDLPGCVSSGDSVQAASEHAFEALAPHISGMLEDRVALPPASPLNAPLPGWLARVPGRIAASLLVPVKLPGRSMRIGVTLDRDLLERVNAATAASGETRSDYIAKAVRERIERERSSFERVNNNSSGHRR